MCFSFLLKSEVAESGGGGPSKVVAAMSTWSSTSTFNCECHDAVVHVASSNRKLGRKHEEDCRDDNIGDAEQIGKPCESFWKLEVPSFRQHAPAAHAVDGDWDCVADPQRCHRCRSDSIERGGTAQEDAPKDNDNK